MRICAAKTEGEINHIKALPTDNPERAVLFSTVCLTRRTTEKRNHTIGRIEER